MFFINLRNQSHQQLSLCSCLVKSQIISLDPHRKYFSLPHHDPLSGHNSYTHQNFIQLFIGNRHYQVANYETYSLFVFACLFTTKKDSLVSRKKITISEPMNFFVPQLLALNIFQFHPLYFLKLLLIDSSIIPCSKPIFQKFFVPNSI